ncbi:MAG: hypothetical protein ACRD06_02715, partial [Terriglobia bacterium]
MKGSFELVDEIGGIVITQAGPQAKRPCVDLERLRLHSGLTREKADAQKMIHHCLERLPGAAGFRLDLYGNVVIKRD